MPASALPFESGLEAEEHHAQSIACVPAGAPIRILHITESALGGVGSYLNQVLPNLEDWRDEEGRAAKMLLVIPRSDLRMVADVDPALLRPYARRARSIRELLRFALVAAREIRRFRPDIVHLHSTFAGLVGRPLVRLLYAGRRNRPKIVYSAHGWAFEIPGSRLRIGLIVLIERLLAQLTDRIILLSDHEMNVCRAKRLPADRLTRVYNGIAAQAKPFAPRDWADDRLKVLFIGRFDRQKGLDILFRAVRDVPHRIVVRCAGANVADGAVPIEPPDNVVLMGWLSEQEIQSYLATADLVAMPSRWEGFGLVAIEAMRAAKPVVGTCMGGLPEVIADGITGRLVPAENPEALRSALLRDGAEDRRRLGLAGRARFLEKFTIGKCTARLGEIYRGLLAS